MRWVCKDNIIWVAKVLIVCEFGDFLFSWVAIHFTMFYNELRRGSRENLEKQMGQDEFGKN